MSNALHALLPTQALDLAAMLDPYGDACHALVRNRADPALLQQVRAGMRAMGERAAMLPALWVPWGAFAVLHFKLMHPRWRNGEGKSAALADLVAEHDELLEALRRRSVAWAVAQRGAGRPGVDPAVLDAFSAWDKVRRDLHEARCELAAPAVGEEPVACADLRRQADGLLTVARASLEGQPPIFRPPAG